MDEHGTDATAFWEDFYQDRDEVWSGRPNPLLVREVEGLTPGSALDLGCGEGADAIWLAERGWRVTAVDVSATALTRAAARAAEVGVRIEWARHDLGTSFPDGTFDLVSAQFFHSPVAPPAERDTVLRRAVDAVAAGGVLLVGSHAGWPSWVTEPPFEHRFPTVSDVLDSLALPADRWRVEVAELVEREHPGPAGQAGCRADSVVRAVRLR